MTDEERKQAWQALPEAMRNDIVSLYNEHWITVNTRRRLERIFGRHNLTSDTETNDNNNMEEKELNLVELLKGCEGEKFWSTIFDVVELSRIDIGNHKPLLFYWKDGVIYTRADGVMYSNTLPTIYPSLALYEKYPLDAYSAWMEWKSERTPKRWRAKQREDYWFVNIFFIPRKCTMDPNSDFDNKNYKNGNMFPTEELAQQAAEAVRECLMKFQEKNLAKNLHNPK